VLRGLLVVRLVVATLWLCLVLAAPSPGVAGTSPEPVLIEPAPDALGEATYQGVVIVAAEPGDSTLYLLEAESGRVHQFREDGHAWGKPIELRDERGQLLKPRLPAMAVQRGRLLVTGVQTTALYKVNGDRLALSRALPFALDAVGLGPRGWLVTLAQLTPNFKLSGGADPLLDPEERARVVAIDQDLDLMASALELEDEVPSGLAAARALKLAFDGSKVWAAELANYRLFRLSEGLELEETLEEPELFLEETEETPDARASEATAEDADEPEDGTTPEVEAELPPAMARFAEERPMDLATGKKTEVEPTIFRYRPVIRDVAWDPVAGKLVLLLAAGGAESGPALDLLDPTTHEICRVRLDFPTGHKPGAMVQMAVTESFLWLRNLNGQSVTYRLHRADLARCSPVSLTTQPEPRAEKEGSASGAERATEPAASDQPRLRLLESPVTLRFPKEAPVRELLETFGQLFFGQRVEIAPGIDGTFSGSFEKVPLEKALDELCARAHCDWSIEGAPPRLVVTPAPG